MLYYTHPVSVISNLTVPSVLPTDLIAANAEKRKMAQDTIT